MKRSRRMIMVQFLLVSCAAAFAQDFQIAAGRGYTVCEAYLRNLNAFPQRSPERVCKAEIHESRRDFQYPNWRALKLEEVLPQIYEIEKESNGFPLAHVDLSTFGNWKRQFEQRVTKPTVRVTDVRAPLYAGKSPVTVLEYDPVPGECQRRTDSSTGVYPSPKKYYVYTPDTSPTIRRVSGALSGTDLLLFRGMVVILQNGTTPSSEWDKHGKFVRNLEGYAEWIELRVIGQDTTFSTPAPTALPRCTFETPSKIIVPDADHK